MTNQKSKALSAADIGSSMHPFTNARAHEAKGPLVMERGEGIYVYDTEGKKYLESFAGLWSVAVGFSEPRLVEAAMKQMAKLPFYHTFTHMSHEPNIRLAEKLVEMSPPQLTRVSFANSGSEANDTVVKMLWYMNNALGRPKKKKFLARTNAYHGITIASGSLTGLPTAHRDFDLPAIPVIHLSCPHFSRFGLEGESEEQYVARLLAEAEAVILKEGPETIAGFIGEPLMSGAGVLPAPKGYWQGIQALCRKHDIVLVADEVVCGFGRLGTMFGCILYEFEPDIMVLSKQITSSYMPLAAIMFTEKIYNAIADNSAKLGSFSHGFTTTGHPVATAVGLENLKIIQERDLVGNAARIGKIFQAKLRKLAAEIPLVGEVRGVGLAAALQMLPDGSVRRPFEDFGKAGAKAFATALENNMVIRVVGDTIALCPPLIITEDETAELLARLRRVLETTAQWAHSTGLH